jgi:hypothetical protein
MSGAAGVDVILQLFDSYIHASAFGTGLGQSQYYKQSFIPQQAFERWSKPFWSLAAVACEFHACVRRRILSWPRSDPFSTVCILPRLTRGSACVYPCTEMNACMHAYTYMHYVCIYIYIYTYIYIIHIYYNFIYVYMCDTIIWILWQVGPSTRRKVKHTKALQIPSRIAGHAILSKNKYRQRNHSPGAGLFLVPKISTTKILWIKEHFSESLSLSPHRGYCFSALWICS